MVRIVVVVVGVVVVIKIIIHISVSLWVVTSAVVVHFTLSDGDFCVDLSCAE